MIEHEHLRHLEAFARYGTLSKAAEELHISQPTLTRSMQKLEDEIGVPLFLRTKNHLEFNANGELAADYARRILEQTDSMVERVGHWIVPGVRSPLAPALLCLCSQPSGMQHICILR